MDDVEIVSNKLDHILELIYELADYRYYYTTVVDDDLEAAIEHLRNAQDNLG